MGGSFSPSALLFKHPLLRTHNGVDSAHFLDGGDVGSPAQQPAEAGQPARPGRQGEPTPSQTWRWWP
jgi:hypothetical protein